jgi:hypothetical protein
MMRWVLSFLVLWAMLGFLLGFGSNWPKEPNVCSLEYRDAYLRTHESDEPLRRECPYEPWYRR